MLSKRTLGVVYPVGTGGTFALVLLGRFAARGEADLVGTVGTMSGIVLSLGLVYGGYWLDRSDLDGDRVWVVAKWTAGGIGLLTLASLALIAFAPLDPALRPLVPDLLLSNVAAGGVIGALVGTVSQLRLERDTVRRLNERNAVLNRVLRHNIRNEMNVIIGYAEALREGPTGDDGEAIGRIATAAAGVAELSQNARQIQRTAAADGDLGAVDVSRAVEATVDRLRRRYPDATIEFDRGREVRAVANDRLEVVIEQLIENAVRYAGDAPVEVVVDPDRGGRVAIEVADRGPGLPEAERRVLSDGGDESPLRHGSGLGLWLVKWAVEAYGGAVEHEENQPTGSRLTVLLDRPGPADVRWAPLRRLAGG